MTKRRRHGFSLVELLVCTAIISILAAMYMAALSKARRKAEEVGVKESFRQEAIGRMADGANIATVVTSLPTDRGSFRNAYRKRMTTSNGQLWATEVLCEIEDESAFRAYWNTAINPAAQGNLEYRDGLLVARDETGKEFLLKLHTPMGRIGPSVAISWEFLSTELSETSAGTLGTNVRYSDGHVEYARYPGNYPACRSVAELSHRYMKGRSEEDLDQ